MHDKIGRAVNKCRDPRASLEQRLDEEPSGALHAVGMGDELTLLRSGEGGDRAGVGLGRTFGAFGVLQTLNIPDFNLHGMR